MTADQWEVLTDAMKDAAVAKALGVEGNMAPPPYVTAGDADPYENWGILAEMVRHALTRGWDASLYFEVAPRAGAVAQLKRVPANVHRYQRDVTAHRALAAALNAAGLLDAEEVAP